MGLSDEWRATPADEVLRRSFAEPDTDDSGWEKVVVPGHWRSDPAFADHDDPVLYRTRFEQAPGAADRRWWLRFDGIFSQGDVWLDGAYLGDTEGYFFAHEFEVTSALRDRAEHLLAVEVACPRPTDTRAKRSITGVFQEWSCIDPDWNPGGIWRPVHLVETGPIRIRQLVTRCLEATHERAVLAFTAQLDAVSAVDAHVRTTVGSVDHGTDRALAAGDNTVEWTVTVDQPRLWWPHALGDANLEAVTVEVRLRDAAGSRVSDQRRFRTGLRRVELRRSTFTVNGERLFCKGTNLGPTRMALGEARPDELTRDIALARAAGLDLVRMHAHVGRAETYEAADEHGMLVWQDFPLQRGHDRAIRWQAVRQAQEMVAMLAHHPSVVLWCGHNEPLGRPVDSEPRDARRAAARGAARFASQQRPTWATTVLDRSVKRALTRADGTRPVMKHSGVLPRLPELRASDSHLWFGWYWGDERDLPAFAKLVPSQVRFPSEFGAQAVPDADDFLEPDAWPDLDWERLSRTHNLERDVLEAHVPREGHTYESWRRATQEHQATVVRRHVEELRRLKYRPTGGFAQFLFADCHPAVSCAVLDHERRPKLAHAALAEACAPVIVVADRPPARVSPGDALALDVHVISDRRLDLSGQVEAELCWRGGSHRWAFAGEVPADSCVRVGTIQFEVPEAEGQLVLRLAAQVGEDTPRNEYRSDIRRS